MKCDKTHVCLPCNLSYVCVPCNLYYVCVHLVDVVGAIEVGVVDEALPAHGGTGLLEVDAHDDYQLRINAYKCMKISDGALLIVSWHTRQRVTSHCRTSHGTSSMSPAVTAHSIDARSAHFFSSSNASFFPWVHDSVTHDCHDSRAHSIDIRSAFFFLNHNNL